MRTHAITKENTHIHTHRQYVHKFVCEKNVLTLHPTFAEMRQVDSLPSRPAGEDSKLVVTPLPPSNQKYINVEEMVHVHFRTYIGSN